MSTDLHSALRAVIEQFWCRVDKTGDCWLWTGARTTKGYGSVSISGKRVYTHRFSYEQAKGPIPDGMLVQHSCDNPPCVNPAHLSAGTVRSNSVDMMTKDRHATALSKAEVAEVVALRAQKVPYAEIASRLNHSAKTLRNVMVRERHRVRGVEPKAKRIHYRRPGGGHPCGVARWSKQAVESTQDLDHVTCTSCCRLLDVYPEGTR